MRPHNERGAGRGSLSQQHKGITIAPLELGIFSNRIIVALMIRAFPHENCYGLDGISWTASHLSL